MAHEHVTAEERKRWIRNTSWVTPHQVARLIVDLDRVHGELFARAERAERAEAALVEACRQSEEAQLRESGSDADWHAYGAKSDAEIVAEAVGYDLAAKEGE